MKITKIISSSIILCFLSSGVLAADLNSTRYLLKGQIAPFPGYLVDQERIEKSVRIAQELDYQRKLNEIQEKYYEEKIKNEVLSKELELEKERKERAFVEKGLKDELAKKNVWYKQWYIVVPATVLSIIFFKTYIL